MSNPATEVRAPINWERVIGGLLLGFGVLLLGGWGLHSESVAGKWTGSETPHAVHARLESTIGHDRPTISKHLVNVWVPQLLLVSESHPDLTASVAEAHDLADYLPLRKKYRALLLFSGTYNFDGKGRYISVVPKGYRTPKQALAWCHKAHLGPDRCVAKRLTHGPVAKSVVTR